MPTSYNIQAGDTLGAIAKRYGTTADKLYNDPLNVAFRVKRPDPNRISAGDVIVIPDGLSKVPYYEVPGMKLIPQDDSMACWYASARMLVQWKQNQLHMCLANLVSPEFDAECRRLKDLGGGLVNQRILSMAERLGLQPIPPMSPSPQAIEEWLRDYGPLWVNGLEHIVVIAGINDMKVKVYDPWPVGSGKINWRSLSKWYVGGENPKGQPDSSRDTDTAVEAVFLHCP